MPFSAPPIVNNQALEAAVQVTNAWRQQMHAAFHAAASQPMGSQVIFRSNSALNADAFAPLPPVPPGQTVPHLIRTTILQFGEQILEGKDKGRIVEVILRPWFELTEAILKDPKAAYEVPPEMWEEIVAGRYKEEGWDEVNLTPRSGDLGRDIIATSKTKLVGVVRIIDQVKRYTPPNEVTAHDVRAMLGVLHGDGATKAFVTTTAEFAPGIRSDPLISPFIPNRLELINGPELYRKLGEIIAARKSDNH